MERRLLGSPNGERNRMTDMDRLSEILYQGFNITVDRSRPFDGQPWTDEGVRGKTKVRGLTMRDICDCFVLGWLDATSRSGLADSGTASYNDVFEGDDPDPLAVMQNMTCRIEMLMGIFPNLPPEQRARTRKSHV